MKPRDIVERPMREAEAAGALRFAIGAPLGEIQLLGPQAGEAFNTLAWLVTGRRWRSSRGVPQASTATPHEGSPNSSPDRSRAQWRAVQIAR